MRALVLLLMLCAPAAAGGKVDAKIEVVTLDAQPAIVKTVKAAPDALSDQIGAAVMELLATAQQQKLAVVGPPFARMISPPASAPASRGKQYEVEVGLPLRKAPATKLDGAVRSIELPAGPAAAFVFRGAHRDLPKAHAKLDAWLAASKRELRGARWEVYLTNPITTPDPAAQETKIVAPLVR